MKQSLPWNVAGIPPEAKEAARAAAGREGLSVGDWLTRRILSEAGRTHASDAGRTFGATEKLSDETYYANQRAHEEESRRDREDMVERVARTEVEAENAFRRIEESLRGMTRRLETTERSQNENNRTVSAAAQEINQAAREQAHAFDALAERLERVERNSDASSLRDAVRGLHQGLSRLADQIAKTATESTNQIGLMAGNVETLAGKVNAVRDEAVDKFNMLRDEAGDKLEAFRGETSGLLQAAEERIGTVEQRIRAAESRANQPNPLDGKVSELESQTANAEHKMQELLGRHLASIERNLEAISARIDKTEQSTDVAILEESLRTLMQRLDASEKRNRELLGELRGDLGDTTKRLDALTFAPPGPMDPMLAHGAMHPGPMQMHMAHESDLPPPVSDADLPPFPETPPFPQNGYSNNAFAAEAEDLPPLPGLQTSDVFSPEPESPQPGPAARDYLAAARRAAQATADVDATRSRSRLANLGSDKESRRRVPILAGIAALILLAIVAGYLLTRGGGSAPARQQAGIDQLPPPSAPGVSGPASGPVSTGDGFTPAPAEGTATIHNAPSATSPYGDNEPPPEPGNEDVNKVYKAAPTPPSAMAERAPSRDGTVNAPPAPAAVAQATRAPQQAQMPQQSGGVSPTPASGQGNVPRVSGPLASATSAPQANLSTPIDRLMSQAKAGDARSELVLGLKYLDGDGVAASDSEAMRWLRKSAEQGVPVAQYRLGTMYERGRGLPADSKQAVYWYQEAAKHGNRKAMHNMAVAYAEGSGVERDYATASRWFRQASDLGLTDSQFNLAVLYERGLGVPMSLQEAYKWYLIASANGDTESKARVDAIATQMPPADRQMAERDARAFRPKAMDQDANEAPDLAALAP